MFRTECRGLFMKKQTKKKDIQKTQQRKHPLKETEIKIKCPHLKAL